MPRRDEPRPPLPTLAQHSEGMLLRAECKCGHQATLDVPKLIEQHGAGATIVGLTRVLVCSACGGRGAHVWITPMSTAGYRTNPPARGGAST